MKSALNHFEIPVADLERATPLLRGTARGTGRQVRALSLASEGNTLGFDDPP